MSFSLSDFPPAQLATVPIFSGGQAEEVFASILKRYPYQKWSFARPNARDARVLSASRSLLPSLAATTTNSKRGLVGTGRVVTHPEPGLWHQAVLLIQDRVDLGRGGGVTVGCDLYPHPPSSFESDLRVGVHAFSKSASADPYRISVSIGWRFFDSFGEVALWDIMRKCTEIMDLGFVLDSGEKFQDLNAWGQLTPTIRVFNGFERSKRQGAPQRPGLFEFTGISSWSEAHRAAERIFVGLKLKPIVISMGIGSDRENYDKDCVELHRLGYGWHMNTLCRRDPAVDPFADPSLLPSDAPRWIPMVSWWRRYKKDDFGHPFDGEILCSILRFPEGLRFEFCTGTGDIEWLRKHVAKMAPDLEVVQVTAPGTSGALYDF